MLEFNFSNSSEEFERNQKRGRGANTPETQCYICGSRCKNPKYFVHVHHGGAYFLAPGEKPPAWIHKNGDLGLQCVGTSCVKKYPQLKPYLQKMFVCKGCGLLLPDIKGSCHYCMSPEERMTREANLYDGV